jgi:hypothetical protein
MKSLVLSLGVLLSVSSSFAGVSVIIDGQNYSCSQGGSGGGNQCECLAEKRTYGDWGWVAKKRGDSVSNFNGRYDTEAEALRECQRWTVSNSQCYN